MSKRQMQERKQGGEDERGVAKSKPARNLVTKTLSRFQTALSSSLSQSPGNLTANCTNFGFIRYGEARSDGFEQGQRTRLSSVACRCKPELQYGDTCCEIDKEPSWYKIVPRNLDMSPSNVEYLEKTYSYVRARRTTKWSGSTSTQRSGDHFMNASMKAAVHVGTDSEAIVRDTRTPEFSEIRCSLSLKQEEVVDQQKETFGISTIEWDKFHG